MSTTLLLTGLAAALVGLASFLYGRTTGEQRGREQARRDLDTIAHAAADRTNQQAHQAYERATGQAVRELKAAAESDRQLAQEKLETTTAPLHASLKKWEHFAIELEGKRAADHSSLHQLAQNLSNQVKDFQGSANSLRDALKGDKQVRGRWGEIQLQQIVEDAELMEHSDFATQTADRSGRRPDLILRLPGGAYLAVDSKVPMDDYLKATEASDDPDGANSLLKSHAQRVKEHIKELAGRSYADASAGPRFTVMFLPLESLLSEAIRHEPKLLQFAANHQIVLATPYTLMGLLWSVRATWRNEKGTRNVQAMREEGEVLRKRLQIFLAHLADVGTQLQKTTKTYNDAVGSADSRLVPQLRKLRELGGEPEDAEGDKLPEPVDITPRQPNRDDVDIPPERQLL